MIDKKIIAAILSFLLPGLGQIYCSRVIRGMIVFAIAIFLFYFLGDARLYISDALPNVNISRFIAGFVAAFDAYRVAPKTRVALWQNIAIAIIVMLVLGFELRDSEYSGIGMLFFFLGLLLLYFMLQSVKVDENGMLAPKTKEDFEREVEKEIEGQEDGKILYYDRNGFCIGYSIPDGDGRIYYTETGKFVKRSLDEK
ncbi:MAG: hypothetical protein ACP5PV_11790 [Methanothrix sp.]